MTSIASPTSPLSPDPAQLAKSRASRRSSRAGEAQLQAELASAAAQSPPSGRRKSQSHITSPPRALPYPATKPARRPSQHNHSQSASAGPTDRRGSLPSLHLRSASQRTAEPVPPLPGFNYDSTTVENPNSDYSSLQSFTFGVATGTTARPTYEADTLSPLATSPSHEDRTPRPSIFRARDDDPNDQDEQERCQRAKMRAIDYGERRPSLPTNLNLAAASAAHGEPEGELAYDEPSTPMPGPSMTPPPDANQTPERTSLSDVEVDADAGIDTDIEYSSETEPDSASIHTFGGMARLPRSEHVTPWEFQAPPPDSDEDIAPDVQGRRPSAQPSTRTVQQQGWWNLNEQDPNRDREDSVATIRRPSDAAQHLENMHLQPPPEAGSSAYEGMDLQYIMGDFGHGSRRSSLSFVAQPLPLPPSKGGKKGKQKDKGKGKEKSQDIQEYLGNDASIAPWANDSRRPSQATISGDDTFQKGLRFDPEYEDQQVTWSFHRQGEPEPGNGTSPSGRRIKWTSVSRCAQIGILRSERSVMVSSEQSRRPAERLNVYHVADPSNEGNKLGGPGMLVHKHSRAKAFAMYRFYDLHSRRHQPIRSARASSVTAAPSVASGHSRAQRQGSTHGQASLPPSKGILLAPKSVMTQFTNTHSTRNLEDHGLLAEPHPSTSRQRAQDDRRTRSASRDRPRERAQSNRLPERPPLPFKEPRKHIIDPKALPEIIERSNATATVDTTSSGDATASIASSSTPLVRHQAQESDEIVPITVVPPNAHSRASSENGDDEEEEEEDEEGVLRHKRTTYAEAYGTLDQPTLERLRQDGGLDDKARRKNWVIRAFRGQPTSRGQAGSMGIKPSRVPWVTLAPRGQQEEQASAIKTLNSSFVDVGLLPSYRKKASQGQGVGRQGHGKHAEVLTTVPDDALCMLLPLWPTETDPDSARMYPNERAQDPPLEERLYLLVYLVRFVDGEKEGQASEAGGSSTKKRPRVEGERDRERDRERQRELLLGRDTSATVVFNCFRAIGRLMTYDDLKGSNVRLPVHGLSVTGSLAEARRGIPAASLRDVHKDDYVIAICADRRKATVELFPDGLDRLGLCVRDPNHVRRTAPAEMQHERNPEQEPAFPLTAIGRAAVEMTWLACMSLMSFGDV
ncbi:unnamed protein product [Peniophora sp. CBMAI 1063]|nr:unnamed protein product [Peniophora sp. CBMAI 1063]